MLELALMNINVDINQTGVWIVDSHFALLIRKSLKTKGALKNTAGGRTKVKILMKNVIL